MSRFSVRSVDVGFGNTKFILREDSDGLHCDLFPSIAPLDESTQGLDGGVLSEHRSVRIEIAGKRYVVGKDSDLALRGTSARTLDRTFSQTDEYLALVRGALHYMGASEISLLVVGLPVTTIKAMGPALQERLTGTHVLRDSDPTKKVVNVHRVKALPQPLGAFVDFATRTGRTQQMSAQRNLIIDVGYFTVDWLVCDGLKSIGARSDAYNGGVSSIVRSILREISSSGGAKLSDHTPVDRALRTGKPIMVDGKEVPIDRFRGLIDNNTQQAANAIAAGIETSSDIHNILLAGGGAELYADAIKAKFPGRDISIVRDPIFANVRGFQLAGNQVMLNPATVVA